MFWHSAWSTHRTPVNAPKIFQTLTTFLQSLTGRTHRHVKPFHGLALCQESRPGPNYIKTPKPKHVRSPNANAWISAKVAGKVSSVNFGFKSKFNVKDLRLKRKLTFWCHLVSIFKFCLSLCSFGRQKANKRFHDQIFDFESK